MQKKGEQRKHLSPGGLQAYNASDSRKVMNDASAEYVLVYNSMAVSQKTFENAGKGRYTTKAAFWKY